MGRKSLLFVLAALCAFAAAPGPWRKLIHKSAFTGWHSPSGRTDLTGAWEIHNGVLTVKPFVQHRTDLWSDEEYGDFELEWEWKAAIGANSGVKYWVRGAVTLVVEKENEKFRRIPDPKAAKPEEVTIEYSSGFEYQMADDANEPDAMRRAESRAGALYSLYPPQLDAVKPYGQWNHSRLLVRDGRVEHWLNGQRVLAYSIADVKAKHPELGIVKSAGPLALQYHQTQVSFRRMRIRRW